jgi:lipoate-protein ligase A
MYYPNTSKIIFFNLDADDDLWEGINDDDVLYYQKNPENYFGDFQNVLEEIYSSLVHELKVRDITMDDIGGI